MYQAEVLADSVAPNGRRATSMLVTLPQMVEQELLRHRSFSFSFGSTRAIPIKTQIERVFIDPVIPVSWGRAGRGMQAKEELTDLEAQVACAIWLNARNAAAQGTRHLTGELPLEEVEPFISAAASKLLQPLLKVHKQVACRLLQPWAWRTGVMTATSWRQFFLLRCHPDAQPDIAVFAYLALGAYLSSVPEKLEAGEWHMPYTTEGERVNSANFNDQQVPDEVKASAGRCAWVSFRPFDAGDPDPKRDFDAAVRKHDELVAGSGGVGHWSPLEHQAQALGVEHYNTQSGNLKGFLQYRQLFPAQDMEDQVDDAQLQRIFDERPGMVRRFEEAQ